MKVLHLVSSSTLTGPAAPALGLARGLRALGVDAMLACDRVRRGDLTRNARSAGVPLLDGSHLCARVGLRAVLADRAWLRVHARRFDLIHAHASHDHAVAAVVVPANRLVRSIHHPRGVAYRPLRGWVYRRTGGFVVLNGEDRESLARRYPQVRAVPVAVAAGAVDIDRFHPGVDGSGLRARFGFGVEDHVVGLVARIKPGRGHDRLLAVFDAARARDPRLRLALIGKGEGRSAVEADVEARGLSRVVRFYGFRDTDLAEAIRSCDVTVLFVPGNDAGCRGVLESMACGVPVIGCDVPAVRGALDGAGAGWIVSGSGAAAWAAALGEFFARPAVERQRMGRKARARVLARFTEQHRAQAVLGLYRRLRVGV